MPTIFPVGPVARNGIFAFISAGKPAAADRINILALSVKVFSPLPRTSRDIDGLKIIVTICAVGLTVSLLLASYGVDLSPAFF
jgi:hypothetical protein